MRKPSRGTRVALAAVVLAACEHTPNAEVAVATPPAPPPVVAVAAPAPPATAAVAAAPRIAIAATPGIQLNAPGPVPRAPPPARRATVMPSFPALPAPTKYPRLPGPVRGPDIEGCGNVWSGTDWVPLACITQRSGPHRGAEVVIPYDRMRPPIDQLPRIVDHRAEGTEGPVRKQFGPECSAFALTGAMDHSYAHWMGTPGAFSVMQTWARYHRKDEHRGADAIVGDVVSNEVDWPYDGDVANSWNYCHGDEKPGQICGQPVDQAKLAQVDKNAVAVITKIEAIPTSELDVLREKLAAGQDVVVTLMMPSFATAGTPGQKYVVGIPPTKLDKRPQGKHVTLLSGYAMTPNGNYYLVHNSWGPKWGDGGFAWLHEDFLKAYWMEQLMVIPYVEPLEIARRRVESRGGLSAACDGDQQPDSITGLCAPRCPDGSPRHNDVCARPGDCLAGQVNLAGECLLAAPSSAGVDQASRVTWSCGPGGCAYFMPQGVLGCNERVCSVSCPAPDFRLATAPEGFVCVD